MIYRAIGVMSGSSLDGLDLAFVEFEEQGGKWSFVIRAAACYDYDEVWKEKLRQSFALNALDHALLHTEFGHFIGENVLQFMETHQIHYQVGLISSHGHTSFHIPEKKTSVQLGDGAAIAAKTGLPVVTDLRSLDVALGGQGAPIVPIGEKYLLSAYEYFLNLGGIANISSLHQSDSIAFDICPANRVLNMLASLKGLSYDEGGVFSARGTVNDALLSKLNALEYYSKPYPKSLANDFGTEVVYPMIMDHGLSVEDGLRTYSEHIAVQLKNSMGQLGLPLNPAKLLVTGGGAFNHFLVKRISEVLAELNIEVIVPDALLVSNKEAIIMAFLGVLRWRQEINVMSSVTGASRDSSGGALWIGAV